MTVSLEKYRKRFATKYRVIDSGCWEWTAARHPSGYGAYRLPGKNEYAHRASFRLFRGEIPEGVWVCHTCDNRWCVNPDHLWLGSAADNNRDRQAKGRSVVGSEHVNSKLTESDVYDIREMRSEGKTLQAIADRFGVSLSAIHLIATGKTWGWLA